MMGRLLLFDLRRAFLSREFACALAFGLAIAALHVAAVPWPYAFAEVWQMWREGVGGVYPPALQNSWLGQTPQSVFTALFYYALPLLACIPYGASLCSDISSGHAAQAMTRSSRGAFVASRAVAAFVSAGVVVSVPLALDFLATACLVPDLPPEPAAMTFAVGADAMLADLFYASPGAYTAVFLVLAFVLAGFSGLASVAVGFLVRKPVIAVLAPFAFCMAAQFALQDTPLEGYAPVNAVLPYQPGTADFPTVLVLLACTFAALALFSRFESGRYEGL